MSRLVALFHRDGRPADAMQIQRMIAPVRRSAAVGPRTWIGGVAALAYQCLRDESHATDLQPAGAGELALCFDGRLDNREELAGHLASDVRDPLTTRSDADLVLACYHHFGEFFATHLNGDFALALFDGRERRLLLARDRMGICPLYFWESADVFLAASEIKCILAHAGVEARPDNVTIADVLVGGDPHELRRTFFHNVRRVLPGYTVVVSQSGVRELRHWDFDVTRQVRCASQAEYAETLRGLFEQAVRRRLRSPGSVAVKVSGGLDSSAIFCAAKKLRHRDIQVAPAEGISMVFPDGSVADEKQFLNDIEAMYPAQIQRLPYSSFEFVDDEKCMREIEYPRLHWNSDLDIFEAARRSGCTSLLDGYYGDQMMASHAHLFELGRKLHWWRVRREFLALAQSMTDCIPSLLQRELLEMFLRDMVPDWLMRPFRTVRRLRDSDMYPRWFTEPIRRSAFQRCQQQRRPAMAFASKHTEICYRYFLAPHRLDVVEQTNKMAAAHGLTKAYPFMDRDLVAFIISVPASVMNWGGVFKGLFREAMRGILPESIRLRFWKADFTPLNSRAAASGYPRFQRHLHSNCLAVNLGYLDRAELHRTLALHQANLSSERLLPIVQVNSLVGLELWLRAFFQNRDLGANAIAV